MLSRSIVSIILALSVPLTAFASDPGALAARSLADEKSAAESQTTSAEEERAAAEQEAFERDYEFEDSSVGPNRDAELPGKEPDFHALLRRGVKQRVGKTKKTVVVVPAVTFGVRFTGPSEYHEGENTQIPPASTNKVFTAALVLKELGPDYRYETRLTWVKTMTANEAAYVTLIGAGDPSLTTADLPKLTDEYVAGLVAAGVKKIYGPLRFSATDARWNLRTVPDGWKTADLRTTTGFIPDELGTLTEARVKAALAAKIAKKGIKWVQTSAPFGENAGIVQSASHFSAEMRKLIQPFVLHSINYKGEAFLRKVGELKGSRFAANLNAAGVAVLREFVAGMIGPEGGFDKVILNDGSGLSRTSRVTAQVMVNFLTAVKSAPYFADFFAALPTAGRSGTLGRRMAGTSAAGRIHAKTGTLDGNYQLAGYLTEVTKAGTEYHPFSILTDTDAASAGYVRSVEDSALANLAAWMLKK